MLGNIYLRGAGGNETNVGIITATRFGGDGSSLTNLNASNISSGTIAATRVGDISGNAASADTLDVSNSSTNSTFYPTFVDNNGSGKTFY